MPTACYWKKSFSKLFVTSLIVGLGACSSKKATKDGEVDFASNAASSSEENIVSPDDVAKSSNGSSQSSGGFRPSSKVEVETSPINVDGFSLNGIYFVRGSEESWASISEKLYGRPDRDQLLKKWNKGKALNVGSAVYYNSPSRPNDSNSMKPFAMDFGSSLEKHVVQRGESLSSIAQSLYGDAASWKEISALNPNLENPDSLEVGQEIYLQPKNVDSQAFLSSLIAQTEQSSSQPPSAQASVDQSATNMDSSNTPTAPPVEEERIVPPPVEQRPEIVASQNVKRPQSGMGGWLNSISGNGDSSNYFAIGLVLILGAIVFLIVNKRRKAAKMHRDEITNLTDFQQKTGSQD